MAPTIIAIIMIPRIIRATIFMRNVVIAIIIAIIPTVIEPMGSVNPYAIHHQFGSYPTNNSRRITLYLIGYKVPVDSYQFIFVT